MGAEASDYGNPTGGTGFVKQGPAGTFASAAIANSDLPGSGQITVNASAPASGGGTVALGGTVTVGVALGTTAATATAGNDVRLNPAPVAAGGVAYDTGAAWAKTNVGTSSQVLHGGAAPAYSNMLSTEVSYTPTTPTNWSPVPSTDQAALDQIAARITSIAGGKNEYLVGPLSSGAPLSDHHCRLCCRAC